MADTVIIETPVATVLEVSGLQGPQGPQGASQADVLTTQGDLLYRGASEAARLPIGTSGQVLKVSGGVPAWANESGGVPTSRTISAGTGLTGGGDLTANRTLSVSFGSAAGTACEGNDARLSDARTPSSTLAHAASHGPAGSDPITHAFRVAVSSGSFSGTLLYAGESNGKPSWGESGQDVVTLSWNGTKWQLFPAVGGGFIYYESTDANIFSANWTIVSGQGSSPTPTLTFDFVRLGDFAAPIHGASHGSGGNDPIFDQNLNTDGQVTFQDITTSNFYFIDGGSNKTATFSASDQLTDNRILYLPDATGTIALTSDITSGGEVRFDTSSSYTYTGLAAAGTSESTASWLIRRSEFNSTGSYVATLTANNVQWANRLTASYS